MLWAGEKMDRKRVETWHSASDLSIPPDVFSPIATHISYTVEWDGTHRFRHVDIIVHLPLSSMILQLTMRQSVHRVGWRDVEKELADPLSRVRRAVYQIVISLSS